jgi:hypothetical protein
MATNGDSDLATSGDFFTAMDSAGSRCESDEPDAWTEPRQAAVQRQVNK